MIDINIKDTRNLFIALIVVLSFLTFWLAVAAGADVYNAFIWTILGVLAVWYPISIVSDQIAINSTVLAVADALGAVTFVLLTAFLTAMFYNFINGVDLRERGTLRKIRKLRDHVIIAPLNGFAEALEQELSAKGVRTVLIVGTEREAKRMYAHSKLAVVGDAGNTELLGAIRVNEAKAVVLCSNNPTENALAAITVKSLNKKVKIIARVNKDEDLPKLTEAGVHVVVLPEMAAGTWLGSMLSEKAMPGGVTMPGAIAPA